MATPLAYNITIFQLEENGTADDIQKNASVAELEYTTGASDNDFEPITVGSPSESVEIDKGVFQIDSMNFVLDGISETYFNAYDDPLNEPFVVVVENAAGVVFHGIIDRNTVDYNAGTGYTAFEAVSWLYVLEQTSAAARSVYETTLTRPYEKADGVVPTVGIANVIAGDDMSAIIQSGDVAVVNTTFGEWRAMILGTVEETDFLRLILAAEPESTLIEDYVVPNTHTSIKTYNVTASQYVTVIRAEIEDVDLWSALASLEQSHGGDWELMSNSFVNIAIELDNGEQYAFKLYPDGSTSLANATGQIGAQTSIWYIGQTEGDVFIEFEGGSSQIQDMNNNGFTVLSIQTNTSIKRGSKIRILGKDIYGYSEVNPFINPYPLKTEIIEGLFGLSDTGIFKYLTDTFNYPSGFDAERMAWFLEFPDNLLESLRLIQTTEYSFLKLTPTLDGSSLPRLTVDLIRRTEANTATQTTTAIENVMSYTEKGADLTPRGVMVKPHIKYNLPNGENRFETRGFWFNGVTTADPALSVPPDGGDVVSVTVNIEPAYTGRIWVSNQKGIRQDDILKQSARRFFEFYENLNRGAKVVVDEEVSRSVLGNYISFNEGGLNRTLFVTSWSRDLTRLQTTMEGLVGEYTESATDSPVAKIDGKTIYVDTDDGGDEDITISGVRSYSPLGLPLTYSWTLDPDGTPSVLGTDPILSEETLAIGTHVIELEVDDGTNTDTARVTIRILADDGELDGTADLEADFVQAPALDVTEAGDVFITAKGDPVTTQETGGVIIEVSDTSNAGPWVEVTGSPFNNPVSNEQIYDALGVGETLWVQVTLVNFNDGTDSSNVWVGQITNHQNELPITTKGDLIVGDASGAPDRLAVGTNDQIPYADSSQPLGIRWGDAPATETEGFTGFLYGVTDIDGNPKRVTVVDGLITAVIDPPPTVAFVYYLAPPNSSAELRRFAF